MDKDIKVAIVAKDQEVVFKIRWETKEMKSADIVMMIMAGAIRTIIKIKILKEDTAITDKELKDSRTLLDQETQ